MAGDVTSLVEWIPEEWEPGIHPAAYSKMKIVPHFKMLSKPGQLLHYRKHANLSTQTLAAGTAGSAITASGNVETEAQASPVTIFVFTEINKNVMARMDTDGKNVLQSSAEKAVAEGVDLQAGLIGTDFTTTSVGSAVATVTEATFRNAIARLAESAEEYYEPGQTEPSFIAYTRKLEEILGDPLFTQFQYRGDGSPLIKGWTIRAHGASFYASNNVRNISGTRYNLLLIDDLTAGVAWNQRVKPEVQDFLLSWRIIAWCDFAVATLWQEYGAAYKTAP